MIGRGVRLRSALRACLLVLCSCGGAATTSAPVSAPHAAPTTTQVTGASDVDQRLAEVARIHGGAGPWAVAGFRMGESALRSLGVPRGSFDLEVVHYSPHEVQYACVADGASAATGASLGKLNLSIESAPAEATHTTYRRRSTQKTLTLRVTKAFAARFLDVPREKLAAAGREAMQLPDAEIFEVVP